MVVRAKVCRRFGRWAIAERRLWRPITMVTKSAVARERALIEPQSTPWEMLRVLLVQLWRGIASDPRVDPDAIRQVAMHRLNRGDGRSDRDGEPTAREHRGPLSVRHLWMEAHGDGYA